MVFNILKIAAAGLLGWAFYRTFGPFLEEELKKSACCADDERAEPEPRQESAEAAPATDGTAEAEDAPAAPAVTAPQDLTKIRGIGPGIAAVLNAGGITTWVQLAAAEVSALRAILDEAGPRYRAHDPSTWPAQAADLAAAN